MSLAVLLWTCLASAVCAQAAPPKDWPDDPQFPIQALFGRTLERRDWAVRGDDAILVVLGGPDRDWVVGWDLVSGQQKYRARVPHLQNNSEHREMGPSGKVLFYFPKEETGKDGRRPRIVNYCDTTTGKVSKSASFDATTPPTYKVPGNTVDDRYLLAQFGGGFHPKQTALRAFEENRKVANRLMTPDFLYVVGHDIDRKSLLVIDAEKPRLVAELPLAPLDIQANGILNADLSGDRSTLVLRNSDLTLKVIDLGKRKPVQTLIGHQQSIVAGFHLSPDATRVISSALDASARLWDAAQGKEVVQVPIEGMSEVGFLTAGEKAGYVVDSYSLRLLKYDGSPLRTVGSFLSAEAELTEDGRAAFDGIDGPHQSVFHFWKLDPPQLLWEERIPGRRQFSSLSADGRHALVQVDGSYIVLNADTHVSQPIGKLPGMAVGLLPGGDALLMIQQKSLVAIDVGTQQKRWSVDLPDAPRGGVLNRPGTHCVVNTTPPRVVETSKGTIVSVDKPPAADEDRSMIDSLLISVDGGTVLTHHSSSRTLQWRSVKDGTIKKHVYAQNAGGAVALSSDGSRAYVYTPFRLQVVSADKGVEKTWELPTPAGRIRMSGEFLIAEFAGSSALLRYVPAGAK